MRWALSPLGRLVRARLARAALRYADRGWPVLPGAAYDGTRFRCADLGCPTIGCHPAVDAWERLASADRVTVAQWWRSAPHSVLLATGHAFDVLEVPLRLGLVARRSPGTGPIAVTGAGRWMFLVRPGDTLRPELRHEPGVVHHGFGSWIPAPPSRDPAGATRWEIAPDRVDWYLPDSYAVQELMLPALRTPLVTADAGICPAPRWRVLNTAQGSRTGVHPTA
jgi:Bifunctional DNA primase/polymerase, N-terminal